MRSLVLLALLAACTVDDKFATDGGAPPDAREDDGTAPETTISSAPDALSRDGTPTFAFQASEPATFVCSIDGETPVPCDSPYTRTLGDGPHTFSVRAIDLAGNADDTPAEHVWSVDTVAPQTTITSAPPSSDNSVQVTFEFTASEEGGRFTCALDGGDFAGCESGDLFGPIDDGAHSFAVRAEDAAGNIDTTPAIYAWAVDTSTPDTQILGGPSGSTSSTTASFTFTSPDAGSGASYQCSLDGGGFEACTSPRPYSALDEGGHTFAVRVRDAVGNVDPTPATRAWTVDLTPPDTTITAGPSGAVPIASASFSFTASEPGSTFECNVDGEGYDACTSPRTMTALAQGAHTFAVRAVDAAGHRDPSPASRTWTVDTIAPDTVIVSGPSGTVGGASATFDFLATEPDATFECALDGAAYAACTDPVTFTVGDGEHVLAVRAVDAAGNPDASPATRSWTADLSAPTVTITGGPAQGSTSGPYVTFTFTASDGTIECSLDADPFAACTSPWSANLPAGAHTFRVRATDGAGNDTTVTRTWTVACAAPTAGSGSVGLFHLDETSGQIAANAAGGADAVLGTDETAETADPAHLATGRFDGGLAFTASDDDRLTWAAGLGNGGDLTIELWLRPGTGNGTRDLVATGDGRVALRVAGSGDTVQLSLSIIDGDGATHAVTSAAVATGAWHHVIATWDEPALRLWVDGVRTDATGAASGMPPSYDAFAIGAFTGDLDELHISEAPIATDADALPRYCPL